MNQPGNLASARFLDAFQRIEKHLKNQSKAADTHRTTFYELVDSAAERDSAVRRYRIDLKEFADLRNAIVHERIGGEPIAEPHMQTVIALETILSQVSAPPSLRSRFAKAVVYCSPSDPISSAAQKMRVGNFSSLPVVKERVTALLTGETIARWLSVAMGEDEIVLGVPVADVLLHTEDSDNWATLAAGASVFDAKEQFDDYHRRGKSLDAILITNSGKAHESLLGIVTIFDYSALIT
jgi:CBS domain-containing protein